MIFLIVFNAALLVLMLMCVEGFRTSTRARRIILLVERRRAYAKRDGMNLWDFYPIPDWLPEWAAWLWTALAAPAVGTSIKDYDKAVAYLTEYRAGGALLAEYAVERRLKRSGQVLTMKPTFTIQPKTSQETTTNG